MAGTLTWTPALDRPDLLPDPVAAALRADPAVAGRVAVAEIDPALADTAAFCEAYGVRLDQSANCVVLATKRSGATQLATCMVLATTRADVNGLARKTLEARKASFAAMDLAVAETGMEYGGITPIGLPPDWPILVDAAVAACTDAVIGSGVRRSKLLLPGEVLAGLPGAVVLADLGR
ncbi:MAG TPA: YbaK/EbsC family protein [Acidimicrobiales bacterium]|nr:YbaK/EbsC family protein [Acidimicrobiales bacterium]